MSISCGKSGEYRWCRHGHTRGFMKDGHCIECERLRGARRFASVEYHDRYCELSRETKRRAKARRLQAIGAAE